MAAVPSIGRADSAGAVAAPEAEATRTLYEHYAGQVFGYCLHQLGSREEAEDAVQSTFLNVFRGLRRGVVPEQEGAWLFAIARNVCLSRRRSSWRRGRIESPADFDVVQEVAPAPSRRSDELIGLQDVLGAMPESQRRAILLREWQGLSYREISAELELSQAAVETLIFRARRALAQGLEQAPAQHGGRRARARTSANLGSLVTALKSLLAGGATAKAVGAAAVVAVGTVLATQPLHPRPARVAPARQSVQHAKVPAAASAPAAPEAVERPRPLAPARAAHAVPGRHERRRPARAVPPAHARASAHARRRSTGSPATAGRLVHAQRPAHVTPAAAPVRGGAGVGVHGTREGHAHVVRRSSGSGAAASARKGAQGASRAQSRGARAHAQASRGDPAGVAAASPPADPGPPAVAAGGNGKGR